MAEIDEMPQEELPVLDAVPRDNIFWIGKRRQRSVYYRPDGTPTKPLPSDSLSQMHYRGKGFTLKPKSAVPETKVEISGIKCPYCDFVPKNALSLRTHLNSHVKEKAEDKANKEE